MRKHLWGFAVGFLLAFGVTLWSQPSEISGQAGVIIPPARFLGLGEDLRLTFTSNTATWSSTTGVTTVRWGQSLQTDGDLELQKDGGAEAAITANSSASASLSITSNDNLTFDLDNNNDEASSFVIRDGADATAFSITEAGELTIAGSSGADCTSAAAVTTVNGIVTACS